MNNMIQSIRWTGRNETKVVTWLHETGKGTLEYVSSTFAAIIKDKHEDPYLTKRGQWIAVDPDQKLYILDFPINNPFRRGGDIDDESMLRVDDGMMVTAAIGTHELRFHSAVRGKGYIVKLTERNGYDVTMRKYASVYGGYAKNIDDAKILKTKYEAAVLMVQCMLDYRRYFVERSF